MTGMVSLSEGVLPVCEQHIGLVFLHQMPCVGYLPGVSFQSAHAEQVATERRNHTRLASAGTLMNVLDVAVMRFSSARR